VSALLPNAAFSGPDKNPQDGYLEFSRTDDDTSGISANVTYAGGGMATR
jgi:hypothetical protein